MLALCLSALAAMAPWAAEAREMTLFDGRTVVGIVHAEDRSTVLASDLLTRDLKNLTGSDPMNSGRLSDCRRVCVVIGTIGSSTVNQVVADTGVDLTLLNGAWERYVRVRLKSKRHPRVEYLLIAGSDRRGTIWGVIDLTRELGVSAWEWWADVNVRRVARLAVDGDRRESDSPSVRYRGVFLNDEDWGLQPWAAKTFEPETGDIGPKTYSRIFELLWRLKANMIWPAMHDSTKPFYQIPGNAETAKAYDIVVGTSHAEPMMRNNVREWDERKQGPFNFITNRAAMTDYWRRRIDEVADGENVFSIGLRGKHDSAMEGVATPEQARDVLTEVMDVQRDMLSTSLRKPATQVPQALTLYKEVLDVYGTGLKVPEDVTLVWPDDNYGYISQLPTPAEASRSGGGGIYYHISTWGRPHDYLWLATTHPALVREQMERAWTTGATRIWVVNVGDIKPGEYLTQYFLDLAFDASSTKRTATSHLIRWAADQFGTKDAPEIAAVLTEYYDLAFERRPEFMGFSQTEPTRPIRIGDYIRSGGGEALARIDRYADLLHRAEAIAARQPADRQDAFFQLVLYPVRGAAKINERNLKLDLAALYARQGRSNVAALNRDARAAHATIVTDTATYNAQNGGKWSGIMDMAPRRLPVFAEPAYPEAEIAARDGCGVDASDLTFVAGRPAEHRLTIYSHGRATNWSIDKFRGLAPSKSSGRLDATNGFEQHVTLRYEGKGTLSAGSVRCGNRTVPVSFAVSSSSSNDRPVELRRVVSIGAADATLSAASVWQVVEGLGSRGKALRSGLGLSSTDIVSNDRAIQFQFRTERSEDATLRIIALPVHSLTSETRLRVGVQIDGGSISILDFETQGRSDEWKEGVLSNAITRTVRGDLAAGEHRIRLIALDPGFILDRIDVTFDGAPLNYGAPPNR